MANGGDSEAHKFFSQLDTNKDGHIDRDELRKAFEQMKLPSSQEKIEALLVAADINKDGSLDWNEFQKFVNSQSSELRVIFDAIDVKGDGKLDATEVRRSFELLYGQKLSENSLNVLMSHMDRNRDGYIGFDEWQNYLMLLPLQSRKGAVGQKAIFDFWGEAACVELGVVRPGPMKSWQYLVAGGVAGVVSRTCTAPLDRLKTIMQLQTKNAGPAAVGIVGQLKRIYENGGIRSFFQGNAMNCVKIIPESATKFYLFESIKRELADEHGQVSPASNFVAGSIGGALSQLLVYPLDCIKTRLAGAPGGTTVGTVISNTYQLGGIRPFYGGLLPSMVGMIPYAGIDLAIYEKLKKLHEEHQKAENKKGENGFSDPEGTFTTVVVPLTCGMISSTCAQFVAYPLSLVRTRLQAQGCTSFSNKDKSYYQYSGMIDVFRKTVKYEGFTGLYKGLGPNFLKVVPSVSLSYLVYENVKKSFR